MRRLLLGLSIVCTPMFALAAPAATGNGATASVSANKPDEPLNTYLTAVTGGQVTAANLLGVDKSAITTIQTSQDIVAAINPFVSGDQKTGFALAITPARTALFPMSGRAYLKSFGSRVLANTTLSYAQNSADIGGANYQKYAVSADTSFYVDLDDDPIKIGDDAFPVCQQAQEPASLAARAALTQGAAPNDPVVNQKLLELTRKDNDALVKCMAAYVESHAKWNASRVALSIGDARIKRDDLSASLGKYYTANATIAAGEQGAWNFSLRRSTNVLDTTSLNTAFLKYSSASLAAARYTYGDLAGTSMRALVEVSNAGNSVANREVFMYAVGIDKNLAKGIWLAFRFGRNRTLSAGKEQNAGLLNLSFQPSLSTFAK